MKKFIIQLILFSSCIILIGVIKLLVFPNYNYSYPLLQAKLNFLEKNPQYNTYFIGSSKINNQINCKIIDEINPKLNSFNLGANAGFNLENFQTLDYVLQNNNFKPKYIVLELQDKIALTRLNLTTERSFGSFNFQNTLFAMKFQNENGDYKQVGLSMASLLLNIFHFNKNEFKKNEIEKVNFDNNGFFSLDKSGGTKTEDLVLKKEIDRRLDLYNKDEIKNHHKNKVFIEKINEYSKKCSSKNIQLILLITGPAEPNAKQLEVYENAFSAPLLNFADPKRYPEFYKVENRWDYGHLNEKGADILSENIGKKFKLILN